MMVGDRRSSRVVPRPDPDAIPSPQPKPGLWQLAQDCDEAADRRGSKYSFLPSDALAGVKRFSEGKGMSANRA